MLDDEQHLQAWSAMIKSLIQREICKTPTITWKLKPFSCRHILCMTPLYPLAAFYYISDPEDDCSDLLTGPD